MSVTFWCPEAPRTTITVHTQDETWEEDAPLPPFDDINLANGNASMFLRLLGETTDDLCGTWEVSRLDAIDTMFRIIRTENMENDYIVRTTARFIDLINAAKTAGYKIVFG